MVLEELRVVHLDPKETVCHTEYILSVGDLKAQPAPPPQQHTSSSQATPSDATPCGQAFKPPLLVKMLKILHHLSPDPELQ